MQSPYRTQLDYQPSRSRPAMVLGASIALLLGGLAIAAVSGILPFGNPTPAAAASPSSSTPEPAAQTDAPSAPVATAVPDQAAAPAAVAKTEDAAVLAKPAIVAKAPEKPAALVAKAQRDGTPQKAASNCANCGAVESIAPIANSEGGTSAVADSAGAAAEKPAYRIAVRMEDGSLRTVVQSDPPAVAQGERVRIVDGVLVRQS